MTQLLDEKQAAALLHVSVKSLQAWRVRGGGPPFVKFGRLVLYTMPDLETSVREALRRSTNEGSAGVPAQGGIRTEHVLERLGRAPLSPPADTHRPAPPQAKSSSAYMAPTSSVDKSAGARERPKK